MSRLSVPPSPRPLTTTSERSKTRSPSPVVERGPVARAYDRAASIASRLVSPPPPSPPPPSTSPVPEEPAANGDKSDGIIDMEVFNQVVELDDDEDDEVFSVEMVENYFEQVQTTFGKMDKALAAGDCAELSSLGHFLKGSSAALGIAKVRESCEKIQHYGQLRDEVKDKNLDKETALKMTEECLKDVKKEYEEAEAWLIKWYKKERSVDLQPTKKSV